MEHHDSELQAGLDGELTPGQAARLSQQPEIQEDFERLKKVDAALKGIGLVDPPPSLRLEVMRQIRLQAALHVTSKAKVKGWTGRLWGSIRTVRPVFQLGLGFALGVLVLSPFILSSGYFAVDPNSAVGTLTSHEGLSRVLLISGQGISGELLRGSVQGVPCVELQLTSDAPVEAKIEMEAPVRLVSLEATNPAQVARFESGTIVIEHEGTSLYNVTLSQINDEWPATRVTISQGGRPLFDEIIP